jgi:hypothetical protein
MHGTVFFFGDFEFQILVKVVDGIMDGSAFVLF